MEFRMHHPRVIDWRASLLPFECVGRNTEGGRPKGVALEGGRRERRVRRRENGNKREKEGEV
jgi:hypothetical protein